MEGQIWFLPRSLQLSSFQAYKLRVTHLYQLKQHSILVSVGEDEEGINPLVSPRTKTNPSVLWVFPKTAAIAPADLPCSFWTLLHLMPGLSLLVLVFCLCQIVVVCRLRSGTWKNEMVAILSAHEFFQQYQVTSPQLYPA